MTADIRPRGKAPKARSTIAAPSVFKAWLVEVEPELFEGTSSSAAATHVLVADAEGVLDPVPIAGAVDPVLTLIVGDTFIAQS